MSAEFVPDGDVIGDTNKVGQASGGSWVNIG
jgi:hypothetical protein